MNFVISLLNANQKVNKKESTKFVDFEVEEEFSRLKNCK